MRERCVLSAFIERKRKRLIDLDRRNLILRSTLQAPRWWTVFETPSSRTVSQTPSTPWGRESAVSAARHGSPECRRLPEASPVPKASFLLQTAPPPLASAVRWLPSCSPSARPSPSSPASNCTHARAPPGRSAAWILQSIAYFSRPFLDGFVGQISIRH